MAADCSFFRLSMAFTTVCVQYCLVAVSKLLIIPLVNSFHDIWAPYCSADGTVLQILRLIDNFYNGCVSYCSVDGTVLLILPLVNGFPDVSRAVFLSGWQCIARSAPCLRFSQFTRCIAQWRAEDCLFFPSFMAYTMVYTQYRSFFLSSTTFPTFHVCYYSTHGSALLVLPLADGFHCLRTVLLSRWWRLVHSSIRQRLSSQFARRITPQLAADCSFFRSSTTFPTVCAPYCTANGSGFLLLPVVNHFHDGSRAVLLSGWQRIADTSARQRLSQRFVRRIAQRMATDCTFFLLSTAFTTVCAPYCSEDGTALLILPLVNGFSDGLHAVLLSGWQRIAYSSTR